MILSDIYVISLRSSFAPMYYVADPPLSAYAAAFFYYNMINLSNTAIYEFSFQRAVLILFVIIGLGRQITFWHYTSLNDYFGNGECDMLFWCCAGCGYEYNINYIIWSLLSQARNLSALCVLISVWFSVQRVHRGLVCAFPSKLGLLWDYSFTTYVSLWTSCLALLVLRD